MEKKSVILTITVLSTIFLWLLFVGQIGGTSGIFGDINMTDEGQFAAWVYHMLNGKYMFKDFFLPYGPLLIYPLYFLVKIFGPSFFIIRFYNTVLGTFLGICSALFVLKSLKINRYLYVAAGVFIVVFPGVYIRQWIGILCILLAVQVFTKRNLKAAFLLGIIIGITFLQSIEIGIFTTITISLYAFIGILKKSTRKLAIKNTLTITLGLLLTFILFAIFALHEGWLNNYIQSTLEFIPSVSGVNLPNGQGFPDLFAGYQPSSSPLNIIRLVFSKTNLFYWSLLLLLLFQVITIIRFLIRKSTKDDTTVFLILSFSLLLFFSLIGRSGHNFLFAPIIVICASYFLTLILPITRFKDTMSRLFAMSLLAFFLLYMARYIIVYRHTSFFDLKLKSQTTSNVSRISPLTISNQQAGDIIALQNFFQKNTKKNDQIFVLNNLPALYFLLDRENPTIYDLPLLAITVRDRNKLVSMLSKNPPKFIIEDKTVWAVDGISDRQRLPEVVTYIEKNYQQSITLTHFRIYKRSKTLDDKTR